MLSPYKVDTIEALYMVYEGAKAVGGVAQGLTDEVVMFISIFPYKFMF